MWVFLAGLKERASSGDPLPSWLLPLLAAPFIGSLVGVLIDRLPVGRPVALARSQCDACGATLPPRDLVPLVSFWLLRGRCRMCGAPIRRFHLAVELVALGIAGAAVVAEPDASRLWLDCGLGWALLALGWIDARHMLLPDVLTLPLIPLGLLATLLRAPEETTEHAAAAALGYLAFRGIAAGYRRWRGREGLGQGDAKLLAAAGAWVGLEGLPWVVGLGALAALLLAVLRRRTLHRMLAVPLGEGLCLAFWAVWLAMG